MSSEQQALLIIKRLLRMRADTSITDRTASRWLMRIVEAKFVRRDTESVNEILHHMVPRQHSSHVVGGLIRQTWRARRHLSCWEPFAMLAFIQLSDRLDAKGLFEDLLPLQTKTETVAWTPSRT